MGGEKGEVRVATGGGDRGGIDNSSPSGRDQSRGEQISSGVIGPCDGSAGTSRLIGSNASPHANAALEAALVLMSCFFAFFTQSETACARATPWKATNSASLRKSSTSPC